MSVYLHTHLIIFQTPSTDLTQVSHMSATRPSSVSHSPQIIDKYHMNIHIFQSFSLDGCTPYGKSEDRRFMYCSQRASYVWATLFHAPCIDFGIIALIDCHNIFSIWAFCRRERCAPKRSPSYGGEPFSKHYLGVIPAGLGRQHCFIIIENDKAWILLTAVTFCDLCQSNHAHLQSPLLPMLN